MIIGYTRPYSEDENLDKQLQALQPLIAIKFIMKNKFHKKE